MASSPSSEEAVSVQGYVRRLRRGVDPVLEEKGDGMIVEETRGMVPHSSTRYYWR